MTPEPKAAPARRSERARSAILTATAELVFEVPYGRLTIEAIAARAGVGKQTIYRWWPTKGAVLFDALLELSGGPDGVALPETGDLRADLALFLRATVAEMTEPRFDAFLRAVMIEIQSDPDLAEIYRDRLLAPQREAIRERLRVAALSGAIRADADLEVAVDLLVGPVQTRWALGLGGLTEAYVDSLLDLVLAAVRPS
ncbi:AcrR family transcriptional regulator [Rhodococcus sp. PvR044]|jgi:AcrR family transcriptional regulator|uniref:TetR/AcrR family transcriptional regulator n=1 Tax=unclassified Rhodococcus (in: high G+C Gram-positive bacteria) TaxID=192944 RepID=UPI000BCD811A|nr:MULTISPECIES: TetR/AcrR family transcriptional regulator [unclassified Rhodococcus (in: high G+C Gram-positive bacteria)]MBP1157960.1 AcrR family transcriptional regulator [Rhodococcus sp. PvR099]PTR37803.1 TetR family transcriptional regulator [Rhodococcus sp. OK611]SNX93234.1 transcriptional regulator, TetR family [Rhodococcus sp. OK270]